MHPAFGVDSYPTSRPIFATNVNSPNDIDRLFDTITYQKVCGAKIFLIHSTKERGSILICSTCMSEVFIYYFKFCFGLTFQGASVIRMMWNFLGPETLRKGLSVSTIITFIQ